jgi:hypothetical protein
MAARAGFRAWATIGEVMIDPRIRMDLRSNHASIWLSCAVRWNQYNRT